MKSIFKYTALVAGLALLSVSCNNKLTIPPVGSLSGEGYFSTPNHNTILGCFQNETAVGRIQHGSAWWFNDHFDGMSEQLRSLASLGYLAGFIGMLTDSRSFLSYPRHEYFRRILCRIFGEWVEDGFYPEDYETLKEIVEDISCNNARRYFGFEAKKV